MGFYSNIPPQPFAPGVIDTVRTSRRSRLRRWGWRLYHSVALISMAVMVLLLLQGSEIMRLAEAKQEAICLRAEARHVR